jgi:hypothetical protein
MDRVGFGRRPVFVAVARGVDTMGKGLLLWLIGVPIPVILLIAFLYH